MISLSIAEASRRFIDLVHQVCARDEEVLLSEDGKPVAKLSPVKSGPVTGESLAAAWSRMEHLGAEEAGAFESDLAAARSGLAPPTAKWE
jgi:antitoxin (DNA-binding transcriptional repressor) of toxin-antitoxin stability system